MTLSDSKHRKAVLPIGLNTRQDSPMPTYFEVHRQQKNKDVVEPMIAA